MPLAQCGSFGKRHYILLCALKQFFPRSRNSCANIHPHHILSQVTGDNMMRRKGRGSAGDSGKRQQEIEEEEKKHTHTHDTPWKTWHPERHPSMQNRNRPRDI